MKNLFRTAMFLIICFTVFALPLFGQSQRASTRDLGKLIDKMWENNRDIDLYLAESLLKKGADPNGTGIEHYKNLTFLMIASFRSPALTELLLDYGADPHIRNSNGNTAAHYADIRSLRLLADKGARFDITNNRGVSPLLYNAGRDRSIGLLSSILDWEERNSPDFCAQFESRKDYLTSVLGPLLHEYSFHPNDTAAYVLIEKLINDGASPDALNKEGETHLYYAVKWKNVEQVIYLLGKGADPNLQNPSGKTALMAAFHLIYTNSDRPKVEEAQQMIRLLLDSGADPNLQDKDGNTVMMHIPRREFAEQFLSAGADPTIKNSQGRTVLHRWYSFLNRSLLDTVVSRGCSIDAPDLDGLTPLMFIAGYDYRFYNSGAIITLLRGGADPHLRDPEGRTALHHYLLLSETRRKSDYRANTDESVIKAFLAAGARPADTDNAGNSPLIIAIHMANNYEEMIIPRDLMLEHASAEEIELARSIAAKVNSKEKRGAFIDNLAVGIAAFGVPLVLGGLSIGMREGVYKDNPSGNFMGSFNGALDITLGGMALGTLLFLPLASGGGWDNIFPFFGGIFGGVVGLLGGVIITAVNPSLGASVNNNPLLYYLPTATSVIITTLIFSFRD
jgi:ankyrin repeat protein